MKVLLRINHTDLLLPDEKGVQALFKLLANSLVVDDRLYKDEICILKRPLDLQFKTVPDGTKFVSATNSDDTGPEIPVCPFVTTKPRRIGTQKPRHLLNY